MTNRIAVVGREALLMVRAMAGGLCVLAAHLLKLFWRVLPVFPALRVRAVSGEEPGDP
jgi:hypothetical protein